MLADYTEVATGATRAQDDTTDNLYTLREFLSCHAFNDIQTYADIFSKSNLSVVDLQVFDRFIESTIDIYSGIDILPSDEVKTILTGIEKLGQVYTNLFMDHSGLKDCGSANKFQGKVTKLDSLKNYFILMTAYEVTLALNDERVLRNE